MMSNYLSVNTLSHNRNYTILWMTGFLINSLRWCEIIITGIIIFKITSSPFQVTLLLILRFLSLMSFSVLSGIIADRYNKKYCFSVSLFLIAIISLFFYSFANTNLDVFTLYIYSVLSGFFWAMESTVRKALVIESIKETQYAKYISLDTLTLHITRFVGPLLSGYFHESITIKSLFLYAFIIYIICFLFTIFIKYSSHEFYNDKTERYNFKIIFSTILEEKNFLLIYLITIIFNIWAYSYIALLPAIVEIDDFYESNHISYLFAIEALGALFSLIAIFIFNKNKLYKLYYITGTFITLICGLIFCFSTNIYFSFIILFIGGFGSGMFSTIQPILVALYSPPKHKGSMLGFLNLCIGFATIGYLNIGFLSTNYGVKEAILIASLEGLFIILLTLYIFKKLAIKIFS